MNSTSICYGADRNVHILMQYNINVTFAVQHKHYVYARKGYKKYKLDNKKYKLDTCYICAYDT
jgi:hypothetical protein